MFLTSTWVTDRGIWLCFRSTISNLLLLIIIIHCKPSRRHWDRVSILWTSLLYFLTSFFFLLEKFKNFFIFSAFLPVFLFLYSFLYFFFRYFLFVLVFFFFNSLLKGEKYFLAVKERKMRKKYKKELLICSLISDACIKTRSPNAWRALSVLRFVFWEEMLLGKSNITYIATSWLAFWQRKPKTKVKCFSLIFLITYLSNFIH